MPCSWIEDNDTVLQWPKNQKPIIVKQLNIQGSNPQPDWLRLKICTDQKDKCLKHVASENSARTG